MKKICFVVLAAWMMMFCCAAAASAAFTLPEDLETIGDEAFLNAKLETEIVIPDGVERIGARAFKGSSVDTAALPDSLTFIAPDAFEEDCTFEVLPGSYASRWCDEQEAKSENMRISVSPAKATIFPDSDLVLQAVCTYPGPVEDWQWEWSEDQKSWTLLPELKGSLAALKVKEEELWFFGDLFYVRCRGRVNGTLLEAGRAAEVEVFSDGLAFMKTSKAINGDSVFLEWNEPVPDAVYTLRRTTLDESGEYEDEWQEIAELKGSSYTVYGLKENTKYRFSVTARFENTGTPVTLSSKPLTLTTGRGKTALEYVDCRAEKNAVYVEWKPISGAVYDVAIKPEGGERRTIARGVTGKSVWYYGLDTNTSYMVTIFARVPDGTMEEGERVFESDPWTIKTGEAVTLSMEEPTVSAESLTLRWNELPGVEYKVYMTDAGGSEKLLASVVHPYYDAGGLQRNTKYSFRVEACAGTWSLSTKPLEVTTRAEKNDVEYRALTVAEVSFKGGQYSSRNYYASENVTNVLRKSKTPTGTPYSILRREDLTAEEILAAIREAFGEADENDVSLFHIGTHGDTKDTGRNAGCLATVDRSGREGELYMDTLANALGEIKGTVIVWLSSCGSGAAVYDENVPQNGDPDFDELLNKAAVQAFAARDSVADAGADSDGFTGGETLAFDTGEFRREGKFYVLTASRYQQSSYGIEGEKSSFFDDALCKGLEKENGNIRADANRDGKLTQQELFLYIRQFDEMYMQNVQTYPLNSDYVLFVS